MVTRALSGAHICTSGPEPKLKKRKNISCKTDQTFQLDIFQYGFCHSKLSLAPSEHTGLKINSYRWQVSVSTLRLSGASVERYIYTGVPSVDHIRLLTVFPGEENETIDYEMTTAELSSLPHYDALSYVRPT